MNAARDLARRGDLFVPGPASDTARLALLCDLVRDDGGPLADLLDILAVHRDRHCDTCGPKPEPTCVVCRMAWPCGTSIARDAVEAALRGES